jgi:hypothetical protein
MDDRNDELIDPFLAPGRSPDPAPRGLPGAPRDVEDGAPAPAGSAGSAKGPDSGGISTDELLSRLRILRSWAQDGIEQIEEMVNDGIREGHRPNVALAYTPAELELMAGTLDQAIARLTHPAGQEV